MIISLPNGDPLWIIKEDFYLFIVTCIDSFPHWCVWLQAYLGVRDRAWPQFYYTRIGFSVTLNKYI